MKVGTAGQKLGLSMQTYANWVARAREGKLVTVDAHHMQPVSELQAEVSHLKRELAIACEECDMLKRPRRTLQSCLSEVRLHSKEID
jgi:transposase